MCRWHGVGSLETASMLGDISHVQTNKGAREIVHQSEVES